MQLIGMIALSGVALVGLTILLVRAREAGGVPRQVQTVVGVTIGFFAAGVAAISQIDAVPDRFEWAVLGTVIAAVVVFVIFVWRGRS